MGCNNGVFNAETIFKILSAKSINLILLRGKERVDFSFLNLNGKVFSQKKVILVNIKQELHKILPVVTSNLVLFLFMILSTTCKANPYPFTPTGYGVWSFATMNINFFKYSYKFLIVISKWTLLTESNLWPPRKGVEIQYWVIVLTPLYSKPLRVISI